MSTKRHGFYYGWFNLVIASLNYFMYVGVLTYAFGVIVNPMAADLGLSMTMATAGFSGFTLVKSLIAPAGGKIVSKYGTKKILVMGGFIGVLSTLLMAFVVQEFILYMIVWTLMISVSYYSGLSPAQVSISNWFFHKRGLASSVLLTIGGSAGFIFNPILNAITEQYSWRHCWMFIGACAALVLLLTIFFFKEKPEDVGQEMDGSYVQPTDTVGKSAAKVHKTTEPWTLADARREKIYYYIIVLQLSISFIMTSVSNQAVNHLVNMGVASGVAASVVGTFSLINTFARLLIAPFTDRIEMKKIVMCGTILAAIGMVFLMNASNLALAYCFAAFGGCGYGLCMVGPQNMLMNNFGAKDYANISASYFFVTGVLASFNAVINGAIFDFTGSLNAVWLINLVLLALSFICMALMRPPTLKRPSGAEM